MVDNNHLLKSNTTYVVSPIGGYIIIDNEKYRYDMNTDNLGLEWTGDTIQTSDLVTYVNRYPLSKPGLTRLTVLDKVDIVENLTKLAIECRSASKSSLTFNKLNSVMNIPEVRSGDELILRHKIVCDKDLPTTPNCEVEMVFNTTSMLRRDPRFEETEDGFVVSEEFANRIKETDYQRVKVTMYGLEHKFLGFYLKLDIRDNKVKLKCGNKFIPVKVNKRIKKRLRRKYYICNLLLLQNMLSSKHYVNIPVIEEKKTDNLFPSIYEKENSIYHSMLVVNKIKQRD